MSVAVSGPAIAPVEHVQALRGKIWGTSPRARSKLARPQKGDIGLGKGFSSTGRVTLAELRRAGLRPLPRRYPAGAPQPTKQRPAHDASHEEQKQGAEQYAGADD